MPGFDPADAGKGLIVVFKGLIISFLETQDIAPGDKRVGPLRAFPGHGREPVQGRHDLLRPGQGVGGTEPGFPASRCAVTHFVIGRDGIVVAFHPDQDIANQNLCHGKSRLEVQRHAGQHQRRLIDVLIVKQHRQIP